MSATSCSTCETRSLEILETPVERVAIEFIGLNHFVFGRHVWVTSDVLASLNAGNAYSPANIVGLSWSESFLSSLDMLPNPYHQYYFQTKDVLKKDLEAYEQNLTRVEVVQQVEAFLTTGLPLDHLDLSTATITCSPARRHHSSR
ncbi:MULTISPECIES: hypothetical protein [Exiguobacterium]|uniref:family 4 glycosyl hydrolase n=1 Tax=Exiguobacterium TaxID=33986 RepID=UPI0037C04231